MVGHVDDGYGSSAVVAEGDQAAYRYQGDAGDALALSWDIGRGYSHRAHGEEGDQSKSALACEPQCTKKRQRQEQDDDIKEHVGRHVRRPHGEELIRDLGAPAYTFAIQGWVPVLCNGLAREQRQEEESNTPHGSNDDDGPGALLCQSVLR